MPVTINGVTPTTEQRATFRDAMGLALAPILNGDVPFATVSALRAAHPPGSTPIAAVAQVGASSYRNSGSAWVEERYTRPGATSVGLDRFWSGMDETGTAGFTFMCLRAIARKPLAGRPVFYGSGAAKAGFLASFAATNSGATTTPSGALTQLSVAGSTDLTIPAAVSGGGTAQRVIGQTVGDWIDCDIPDRIDGGSGYLYQMRGYTPAAAGTDIRALALEDAGSVDAFGWRSYAANGNHVMVGGAAFAQFNSWAPFAMEFSYSAAVSTALVAGDSIVAGIYYNGAGSARYVGSAVLAARGYTRVPVNVIQCGYGSQTSANFYTNGVNQLRRGNVALAAFAAGSVNDPDAFTAAWSRRVLRMCGEWVTECRAVQARPVFLTVTGNGALSGGANAVRIAHNAAVRVLADEVGACVVDRDAVLSNLSSPTGALIPAYSHDDTHPNGAGIDREALEWTALFDRVL